MIRKCTENIHSSARHVIVSQSIFTLTTTPVMLLDSNTETRETSPLIQWTFKKNKRWQHQLGVHPMTARTPRLDINRSMFYTARLLDRYLVQQPTGYATGYPVLNNYFFYKFVVHFRAIPFFLEIRHVSGKYDTLPPLLHYVTVEWPLPSTYSHQLIFLTYRPNMS